MSFANAIIAKSSTPINYFTGTNSYGFPCYWFVMCSSEKYKMLQSKLNTGHVELADYGQVIASGRGKKPTDKVLSELLEKYNFDATKYFTFEE